MREAISAWRQVIPWTDRRCYGGEADVLLGESGSQGKGLHYFRQTTNIAARNYPIPERINTAYNFAHGSQGGLRELVKETVEETVSETAC